MDEDDRDTDKLKGTSVKQIVKKINRLVINKVQLETVITGVEIQLCFQFVCGHHL